MLCFKLNIFESTPIAVAVSFQARGDGGVTFLVYVFVNLYVCTVPVCIYVCMYVCMCAHKLCMCHFSRPKTSQPCCTAKTGFINNNVCRVLIDRFPNITFIVTHRI